MSDPVSKIVDAGTARAEAKLGPDSGTRTNPSAMADKVLKEGTKAVRSEASKGQADTETANIAQVSTRLPTSRAYICENHKICRVFRLLMK